MTIVLKLVIDDAFALQQVVLLIVEVDEVLTTRDRFLGFVRSVMWEWINGCHQIFGAAVTALRRLGHIDQHIDDIDVVFISLFLHSIRANTRIVVVGSELDISSHSQFKVVLHSIFDLHRGLLWIL